MKRFFLFCFLLLAVACSSPSRATESGKVRVQTTTAMIHDLVAEIGQEWIETSPLVKGEMDPHSYELVKGDDEKIAGARLVIANGLNLEHGASLRSSLQNHPNALFIGEEIRRKVPEKILFVDGEIDPHLWMDISLWAEGVEPIVAALCALDPEHGEQFQKNGNALRQAMLDEHQRLVEKMASVPEEKRYLVTSHDAFHYFARAYLGSSERCIAPEGLAPEGNLSSCDIRRVIDHLMSHEIGVIFPESNVSRAALRKIVSSCAHEVRLSNEVLYGDAMGEGSYLDMIAHNIDVLIKEWQR